MKDSTPARGYNKAAKHEPLSRVLQRVSNVLGDAAGLARLHNATHTRLSALASAGEGDARTREYRLLLRFFEAEKDRRRSGSVGDYSFRRLFLVAIEYVFDDGAKLQGHGDAIVIDEASDNMYVIECKLLLSTGNVFDRLARVRAQADKYASRVGSWITHLRRVDPEHLESLGQLSIHPMILTDRLNRMEKV